MPSFHRPHLLSLAEWSRYFHLDPWHFWGWCTCQDPAQTIIGKCTCNCGDTWREFATFHNDNVSREAVSKAIAEAEQLLMKYLHFAVAPRAFVEQKVRYPEGYWIAKNLDFREAVTAHKYVEVFGVYQDTLIGTAALTTTLPIDYREHFSTASIIVPSGTTAEEIRVYFIEADRFNETKEKWEIRPIEVSISGNTATISIPSYLLALPELTNIDPDSRCLNPDDPASYITEIEIYRRTIDACDQGYAVGRFENCPHPPCERQTQTVCYALEKKDLGIAKVIPATCENGEFTRAQCTTMGYAKEAYANYIAGYPLENGRMAEPMVEAVAYLSAALLTCDLPYCNCKPCFYKMVHQLREIPKVKIGEGQEGLAGDAYKILLDNFKRSTYPLGMQWGALKALSAIQEYRL